MVFAIFPGAPYIVVTDKGLPKIFERENPLWLVIRVDKARLLLSVAVRRVSPFHRSSAASRSFALILKCPILPALSGARGHFYFSFHEVSLSSYNTNIDMLDMPVTAG
jgi:hypothetical protein